MQAQNAVDAEADAQFALVGFDVNIRGVDLYRVFEHRLQQFDNRGIDQTIARRQLPQVDIVGRHFLFEFLRQTGNFFGAPVHQVDGLD